MKKIYFLLPDYPKWFDGGLKYQTIVFNYFKKQYKKVFSFGKTIEVPKSKFRFLQLLYKLIHIFRILIAVHHVSQIPRYSIIVLNNAFFLDYSLPIVLNKLWKKHIYIMIVHHLVQKDRPSYLRKKLESIFIRRADKLITVSKTSLDELMKLPIIQKEIPIVLPGLDIDLDSIPLHKKFIGKPTILYVGSIDKRKGLIFLLEALKDLSSKDFEMNFIGRISYDDYFQLLLDKVEEFGLKDKVFFRGRVESTELKNYYNNSTVFVFPSLWEGYGMAVAEAMAYGLPVIASRLPALEELVSDGIDGYLVEPKTSVQISKALNTLLNDKKLLEKFSRNAADKARNFLSWNDSSEMIWQITRTFLGSEV